jgi:hypothetical protein
MTAVVDYKDAADRMLTIQRLKSSSWGREILVIDSVLTKGPAGN